MPRVPMLFPGQGSQTVGMAADLLAAGGSAAEFLRTVNDTVGCDLLGIMTAGPDAVLTETRNAQPALLAHSVAVTLALEERGILPSLVAGHSLGEFSAAVACSALGAADALRTVRRRGELMFAAGREIPGTMAAVMGLPLETVAAVCAGVDGIVVPANHNSDTQVVISGEVAAVAAAGEALKAAGAKRVAPLNVSGAFHSPLLADAAAAFREFLGTIPVHEPAVPLIANVSAEPATTAAALREGFARQLTAPVLWHGTMERLCGGPARPRLVLEVGPGKVLAGLARRAYPDVTFVPVGTVADLEGLPALLAAALSDPAG